MQEQRERLRSFIRERGTQEQFAATMNVRRETISRIVSGGLPINDHFIGRFFITFGPEATTQVFNTDQVVPAPTEVVSA